MTSLLRSATPTGKRKKRYKKLKRHRYSKSQVLPIIYSNNPSEHDLPMSILDENEERSQKHRSSLPPPHDPMVRLYNAHPRHVAKLLLKKILKQSSFYEMIGNLGIALQSNMDVNITKYLMQSNMKSIIIPQNKIKEEEHKQERESIELTTDEMKSHVENEKKEKIDISLQQKLRYEIPDARVLWLTRKLIHNTLISEGHKLKSVFHNKGIHTLSMNEYAFMTDEQREEVMDNGDMHLLKEKRNTVTHVSWDIENVDIAKAMHDRPPKEYLNSLEYSDKHRLFKLLQNILHKKHMQSTITNNTTLAQEVLLSTTDTSKSIEDDVNKASKTVQQIAYERHEERRQQKLKQNTYAIHDYTTRHCTTAPLISNAPATILKFDDPETWADDDDDDDVSANVVSGSTEHLLTVNYNDNVDEMKHHSMSMSLSSVPQPFSRVQSLVDGKQVMFADENEVESIESPRKRVQFQDQQQTHEHSWSNFSPQNVPILATNMDSMGNTSFISHSSFQSQTSVDSSIYPSERTFDQQLYTTERTLSVVQSELSEFEKHDEDDDLPVSPTSVSTYATRSSSDDDPQPHVSVLEEKEEDNKYEYDDEIKYNFDKNYGSENTDKKIKFEKDTKFNKKVKKRYLLLSKYKIKTKFKKPYFQPNGEYKMPFVNELILIDNDTSTNQRMLDMKKQIFQMNNESEIQRIRVQTEKRDYSLLTTLQMQIDILVKYNHTIYRHLSMCIPSESMPDIYISLQEMLKWEIQRPNELKCIARQKEECEKKYGKEIQELNVRKALFAREINEQKNILERKQQELKKVGKLFEHIISELHEVNDTIKQQELQRDAYLTHFDERWTYEWQVRQEFNVRNKNNQNLKMDAKYWQSKLDTIRKYNEDVETNDSLLADLRKYKKSNADISDHYSKVQKLNENREEILQQALNFWSDWSERHFSEHTDDIQSIKDIFNTTMFGSESADITDRPIISDTESTKPLTKADIEDLFQTYKKETHNNTQTAHVSNRPSDTDSISEHTTSDDEHKHAIKDMIDMGTGSLSIAQMRDRFMSAQEEQVYIKQTDWPANEWWKLAQFQEVGNEDDYFEHAYPKAFKVVLDYMQAERRAEQKKRQRKQNGTRDSDYDDEEEELKTPSVLPILGSIASESRYLSYANMNMQGQSTSSIIHGMKRMNSMGSSLRYGINGSNSSNIDNRQHKRNNTNSSAEYHRLQSTGYMSNMNINMDSMNTMNMDMSMNMNMTADMMSMNTMNMDMSMTMNHVHVHSIPFASATLNMNMSSYMNSEQSFNIENAGHYRDITLPEVGGMGISNTDINNLSPDLSFGNRTVSNVDTANDHLLREVSVSSNMSIGSGSKYSRVSGSERSLMYTGHIRHASPSMTTRHIAMNSVSMTGGDLISM